LTRSTRLAAASRAVSSSSSNQPTCLTTSRFAQRHVLDPGHLLSRSSYCCCWLPRILQLVSAKLAGLVLHQAECCSSAG
jgi:hypothetical protein